MAVIITITITIIAIAIATTVITAIIIFTIPTTAIVVIIPTITAAIIVLFVVVIGKYKYVATSGKRSLYLKAIQKVRLRDLRRAVPPHRGAAP